MGGTSQIADTWPLVGRDETLDELSSALDATTSVLLRGAPGAGKTRVLDELTHRRAERGDAVVRMSGVDATARLPLMPLLSLLPVHEVQGSTGDTVRHALAEMYRRAASAPIVLLVDDAHRLSDEVASFVHHVCEHRLATTVIAAREAVGLSEPLDALWRSGRAVRIELKALSFDHVSVLLEQVLGGVVEPATNVRLWELSRGHPLYLRELVAGAVEWGGLVVDRHGVWTADDRLADGQRVTELIRSRLDDLTIDELDVLIACASQPNIPRRVVEFLVSPGTIASLFARGLLEEVTAGRRRELTPAHPLHAEVAMATANPEHRRSVLGRLAEAWEAVPSRRSTDPAIIAELRLGAGTDVKPEMLLAAARAPGIAPVRAEELAALAESADGGSVRGEAMLERATALGRRGEWTASQELFEQTWATVDRHDRPEVARRWIATSWDNEPDLRATIALIGRFADVIGDDQELADTRLRARMFCEPLDAVLDEVRDRFDDAEVDEHLHASAQLMVATLQAHRGELGDSLRRARTAIESGLLSPLDRTRAGSIVCDDLAWSGRIDDALAAAEILLHESRLDGDVDREVTMRHVRQTALALAGRAEEAAGEGQHTVRLVAIAREVHVGPAVLADLAFALSMVEGAEREAHTVLDELAVLPPSARYLPASIAEVAAAHLATTPEARRDHLAAAAALARERGCVIHLARALHEHHRLGVEARGRDLIAELTDVAGRMDGVASMWLREIVAAEAGDVDGLSALSLEAQQRGLDLLSVESAARAAAGSVGAGDQAAGYVLGRRARRLADRLRGTRLAVAVPPSVLTPSEHRVLEGAVAGMSDRELADRFAVSVRTVQGHLHRSYRKLGLTGRDQISELVARHDPMEPLAVEGQCAVSRSTASRA